jgi:membrane-associated HD superfamily phosphohydrolase
MIADIVESTTKSLDAITENTVRSILDVSVERLISEGQLDEAPITLSELAKVKHAMLPIIMGIYRKRLEYPEQDPSDQQNR